MVSSMDRITDDITQNAKKRGGRRVTEMVHWWQESGVGLVAGSLAGGIFFR